MPPPRPPHVNPARGEKEKGTEMTSRQFLKTIGSCAALAVVVLSKFMKTSRWLSLASLGGTRHGLLGNTRRGLLRRRLE